MKGGDIMDETINKWLWIGIGAVICIVMLLAAGPLGETVKSNISGIIDNTNDMVDFKIPDEDPQ